MSNRTWPARLRRIIITGAAVLAVAITPLYASPAPTHAAPVAGFNAGNIIDDSLFYNGNAMVASEVQSFLNQRLSSCRIGKPPYMPGALSPSGSGNIIANNCLKDFRQTTTSQPGDRYCSAYAGAVNETGAQIIAKVGQACGISQKVLLVMLEKEQSLLTDDWPVTRQYNYAMGMNCPDSGPNNSANCDAESAGFSKQLYLGARQLKVYKGNPDSFNYKPFRNNIIQWNPNPGCGTSQVYIENWATAALYIYTPYRPNQAALDAGWGTGDSCSSYGNRNFYNFYKQWFGSPAGIATVGAIGAKYTQLGGKSSWLGAPLQVQICATNGDCWQQFTNGRIYLSGEGAFATRAEFITLWNQQPDAMRLLGYPTSDPSSTGSDYTQSFAGGGITVTNGVPAITSSKDPWTSAILTNSWLGVSKNAKSCNSAGCWQQFANGRLYSSDAGVFGTRAEFITLWEQQPDAMRALGSPTSNPSSTESTYTQTFAGGAISVTDGVPSITATNDPWVSAILANSWLGVSKNAKSCNSAGCWQQFANGRLYSSDAGVFGTRAEFITLWEQQPDAMRALGSPTSNPSSTESTYTQTFAGGAISVTDGVPSITATNDPWVSAILANSWLGVSKNAKSCNSAGCWQQFANGRLYSSDAGVFGTRAEFITLWEQQPDAMRALGSPTSNPSSTESTYTQTFAGGAISVTDGVPSMTSTVGN